MARQVLVGRDEERDLILRVLTSGGSVVLGGHAGVGKTSLARDLATLWASDGRPVQWSTATAPGAGAPFAAVARLLGPLPPTTPEAMTDRTAEIIRTSVAGAAATPDQLVVIDDGHLLDPASALLVQHLVLAVGSVLVTVRNGEPVDPAVRAVWEDEHATRIDLVALSASETRVAAEHLVGGPFDDKAAALLFEASQGNPLLLRELIRDATDAGRIRRRADVWGWDGAVGRARRLRDAIGATLDAAGPRVRRLMLVVALGQPLRSDVLDGIAGQIDVDEAEDRGLIEVHQDGADATVALEHPMLGEVLLATADAAEVDRARLDLADALVAAADRRPAELLLETRLRIDAGQMSPPAALLAAADMAARLGDAGLALELSTRAADQGAGAPAALLAAEAHVVGGDLDAAAACFEAVLPELADDEDRVRAAFHLHHTYVGLGRHDAAEAMYEQVSPMVADPVWSAVLAGHALQWDYMRGRTRRSLQRAEALLRDHDDPRVRVRLISSIASGRALAGSTESAIAYVAEVLPHALAMSDVLPLAPAWALNAQALSLLVAGRIHEARSMIDLVGAMVQDDPRAVSTQLHLNLYRGRIELVAGRAAEALNLLADVADRMADLDLTGQHRWVRSLTAEARALIGDVEGARRDRQIALAVDRSTEVYEGDAARARAWVLAAEGSAGAAVAELLELADLQELEGQHGLAIQSLNDALRLGADRSVLERLARSLADVDGNWAHALGLHLTARRSGDGADLLHASEAFAAMGADLHAAEAAAEAALAFERVGLRARTSAAARARDEALDRTGPVHTLALLDGPARVQLTSREREVALLAAHGLSNREIADRLFISLRTAEGHLLRATTKLGVSNRSEIAGALGVATDPGT